MFHFSFPGCRIQRVSIFRSVSFLPLIAFPFLIGALSGCVVGSFSVSAGESVLSSGLFHSGLVPVSVPEALWHSFRFILAAAIFATGILGVALIPLLCALRGFSFACSVAFVLHTRTLSGVLTAFAFFGIPALLSLPAFFLAATDAFSCARAFLRKGGFASLHEIPFVSHLIIIAALCAADAAYISFLLPKLLPAVS